MWCFFRIIACVATAAFLHLAFSMKQLNKNGKNLFPIGAAVTAFLAAASHPRLHRRLTAALYGRRWLRFDHSETALHSLVGSTDPRSIIARAKSRFRCARLSDITESDMMTTEGLGCVCASLAKTVEAGLGAVDCFVSHASTDCAAMRLDAIRAWGTQ